MKETRMDTYTNHAYLERKHKQRKGETPDQTLLTLRERQSDDAEDKLAGKTVTVYRQGSFFGKVRHCEVGPSTATVCFTLIERDKQNLIVTSLEITPEMDIFVEDVCV